MKDNEEGEADKMSAQKRKNILVGFGALAIALALGVAYFAPNFNYQSEDASGAIGAVRKHRAPQITEQDVVLVDEATKQEQAVLYADFFADAAELQNISADLESDEELAARVRNARQRLEARHTDLQARYRGAAAEMLDAMRALKAEEQLGKASFQDLSVRFSRQLSAREMQDLAARSRAAADQLGARNRVESFAAQLAAADEQSLDARNRFLAAFDADTLSARMRARASYVEAMANEAATLDAARRAFAAKSFDARSLSARLRSEADQLEARAQRNIEENLASEAALLDAMKKLQARNLNAAFAADLQARARGFEARRSYGLRAQMAAIDSQLEGRKQLGRRAALASASEANLAAFAQELGRRINQ
jgi:hypothetical protein